MTVILTIMSNDATIPYASGTLIKNWWAPANDKKSRQNCVPGMHLLASLT